MLKELVRFIDKNSPVILTSLGVVGVVTTAVSAASASPKALDILSKNNLLDKEKPLEEFKTWEKGKKLALVKDLGVIFAPTLIIGSLTVFCVISANRIASRRTVALASLYSLAEKNLDRYKIKADEIIGEKKMQKVKDAVEQEKLSDQPIEKDAIIVTGRGESLCFETLTGRYFRSDRESIRKAINNLNFELLSDMYVSLNGLYTELGLEGVDMGEEVGWTVNDIIEPIFTCKLAPNGEPCLILSFDINPKYDYKNFI